MPFRMRPTYIIEHVRDINLDELKNEGIKALVFDLDNTLMAPKCGEFCNEINGWLEEVRNDFKIAVLSNNTKEEYIEKVKNMVDFPVYGSAGKPSRKIALKVIKELDVLPEQCAMVGDRPLTDILVGRRLSMITILVDPLIKHKELPIVKFLRKLERIFIKSAIKEFDNKK